MCNSWAHTMRASGTNIMNIKWSEHELYPTELRLIYMWNLSLWCVLAGRFPSEGSIVAPGMSCKYTVCFTPDSLGDYKDFIVVESQSKNPLVVPIEARRPPPILTCKSCLNLLVLLSSSSFYFCLAMHCWYYNLPLTVAQCQKFWTVVTVWLEV